MYGKSKIIEPTVIKFGKRDALDAPCSPKLTFGIQNVKDLGHSVRKCLSVYAYSVTAFY